MADPSDSVDLSIPGLIDHFGNTTVATPDAAHEGHGMRGQKRFRCDLSGFYFPITERVFQRGLQVAQRFADEPGRQQDNDPRSLRFEGRENHYGKNT